VVAMGGTVRGGRQGWMTMTGLPSFLRIAPRIALIIALALVNFVILGFAAYTVYGDVDANTPDLR
jgi:hypothetical protein